MNKLLTVLVVLLVPWLSSAIASDTSFDLEKHRGKVVYVDFWASWCTPCRASFPFMQEMAEQYGDTLQVIAINVDKNRADADQFLAQFDTSFSIVYDADGTLAESFSLKGMPTSYLFDRNGQLIGSHVGFRKKDIATLSTAIANALSNQE